MPDTGTLQQTEWDKVLPAIKEWSNKLEDRAALHQRCATGYRNLNRVFGAINVTLAAITATTMFAALNHELSDLRLGWQIAITAIAALPAIVAGLQKEWQISAREQGHLLLRRDCKVLLSDLEYFTIFPPDDVQKTLKRWYDRFTEVTSRPTVRTV
jgi:hypothetical protein